jgi:hypothetical protein
MVGAGFILLAGINKSNQISNPNISISTKTAISGNKYVGCSDRQYYEKIVEYAIHKDSEAFQQAVTAGIFSGTCTIFEKGEFLYVIDVDLFSGYAKVRRKGETQEFWVNLEAVR